MLTVIEDPHFWRRNELRTTTCRCAKHGLWRDRQALKDHVHLRTRARHVALINRSTHVPILRKHETSAVVRRLGDRERADLKPSLRQS